MTESSAPKIEFPCDYSLKVIGDQSEDFAEVVAEIVRSHDPHFDAACISHQPSRNGRFVSLRLTMRATGEAQLKALFQALKATGRVHMVV